MFAGTSAALGMVAPSAMQKAAGPVRSFDYGPFPFFSGGDFAQKSSLQALSSFSSWDFWHFFWIFFGLVQAVSPQPPSWSSCSLYQCLLVCLFFVFFLLLGAKHEGNRHYTGRQGCCLGPPQAEDQ